MRAFLAFAIYETPPSSFEGLAIDEIHEWSQGLTLGKDSGRMWGGLYPLQTGSRRKLDIVRSYIANIRDTTLQLVMASMSNELGYVLLVHQDDIEAVRKEVFRILREKEEEFGITFRTLKESNEFTPYNDALKNELAKGLGARFNIDPSELNALMNTISFRYLVGRNPMEEYIRERVWPDVNQKRMLIYCAFDSENPDNELIDDRVTFSHGATPLLMKYTLAAQNILEFDENDAPTTRLNPDYLNPTKAVVLDKFGMSLDSLKNELDQIHTSPDSCRSLFLDRVQTMFRDMVVGRLEIEPVQGMSTRKELQGYLVRPPHSGGEHWQFSCVASSVPATEDTIAQAFVVQGVSAEPGVFNIRIVIAPSFTRNATITAAQPKMRTTLFDPIGYYSLSGNIQNRKVEAGNHESVRAALNQLGLISADVAMKKLEFPQ